MAQVPIILRDPIEDAYFVIATISVGDAHAAVEALTHTVGDGIYRYAGHSAQERNGTEHRFHKFLFDRDGYAWLVGVKP